ncbi:MAG: NAD(P)H-hydrate dehydratase [Solobacterium sp.]|nr:NAD(P)H-hydrate dehydratase [Solobacterium sp.]
MIIRSEEMKTMEYNDPRSARELMELAGTRCAEILQAMDGADHAIVLCGKGNNGGDGFVIARILQAAVCLMEGYPRTEEARQARKQFNGTEFRLSSLPEHLESCSLIVDCVYGYGFHGSLPRKIADAFTMIEERGIPVVSVDINSGCEADCLKRDPQAIHSCLTLALGYPKPFHALRKEHGMFRETRTVGLDLAAPQDPCFMEMNEALFRQKLPEKAENAYKGTFGKTLLIGGSYGMAGALGLNIIGARTVGSSYLEAVTDAAVWQVLAPRFLSTVFHPVNEHTPENDYVSWIRNASGIGFGSGAVHLHAKEQILHLILRNAQCPAVIDAEGLRLLAGNTFLLNFRHGPLILTPHIGEFCGLENTPEEEVREDPLSHAEAFAERSSSIVVLKGANTIVTDGKRCYINDTGNPALAQAGSGDLLTGIITGLIPFVKDPFLCAVMGVWFHGHLADLAVKDHPARNLDLPVLSEYAERFFQDS